MLLIPKKIIQKINRIIKMKDYMKFLSLGCGLFVGACGSTLPLVFVEKKTVGINLEGPNPTEGSSGSISLGYKTKSAAIVPVGVKRKSDESIPQDSNIKKQKENFKKLEDVTNKIKSLSDKGASNSDEAKALKQEKEQIIRELKRKQTSYDLILSEKDGNRDALSVLGKFKVDGEAQKEGANVGLEHFFSTGSAAVRLADGFAAQLGAKNLPVKANDDHYELAVDQTLEVSVLANDLFPSVGKTTRLRIPAKNGTALIEDNGKLKYTPNTGFKGEDLFSYALVDQEGNFSTAKVTVKIE